MGSPIYNIAAALVIIWMIAIGLIGYHVGGVIHILSVIVIISAILGIIRRKKKL